LDVTVGSNTSSVITITFCASLVDATGTNLSTAYVTAGADYANETFVWIGQDIVTPLWTNRNVKMSTFANQS
jgi:hypothetical protein